MIPIKRRDGERGATLVEASIVFMLLFLTIFAIAEFGLAFKDWLTVNHGAREGARVGATYGNLPETDFEILEQAARHMSSARITPDSVRIYDADPESPTFGQGSTFTYEPGEHCIWGDPDEAPRPCCDWDPCPHPDNNNWATVTWPWPPSARDIEAPETSILGVTVAYTHNWITRLVGPGTSDFSAQVEMQLEPQLFSGDS